MESEVNLFGRNRKTEDEIFTRLRIRLEKKSTKVKKIVSVNKKMSYKTGNMLTFIVSTYNLSFQRLKLLLLLIFIIFSNVAPMRL